MSIENNVVHERYPESTALPKRCCRGLKPHPSSVALHPARSCIKTERHDLIIEYIRVSGEVYVQVDFVLSSRAISFFSTNVSCIMLVPFPEKSQLNHQLKRIEANASVTRKLSRADDAQCETLPGQPRIRLGSNNLYQQLEKEFLTPDLDALTPHLWLVATQSSSHIGPLHEQILKGREIVLTENPELHLVWADGRIFIKPIPRYMLSHAFWITHLAPPTSSHTANGQQGHPSGALIKAALGYMRTYYHLIQHESDFDIATKSQLLPFDRSNVTTESFDRFIAGFGELRDDEVSPRYSYGTLRLPRLNLWAKVFLRRFQFYQIYPQYSQYFARFYAPILFLFGLLSVALSAMQVGLQANSTDVKGEGRWVSLQSASLWFAVANLLCICTIGLVIALLLVFMLLRELVFATKGLVRQARGDIRGRVSKV